MQKVFTKREKIILNLTIAVIIIGIGFSIILTPILNKYSLINKEISYTRAKFKKYQLLLKQKDNINNKYNKVASKANLSGPGKDTLVSVISELESMAKESNIRIIDIRPQNTTGNASLYKEVIVELKAEGTMEGYFKFIYNIENSLSLLKIKMFRLAAKSNASTLEGHFSISQFSME